MTILLENVIKENFSSAGELMFKAEQQTFLASTTRAGDFYARFGLRKIGKDRAGGEMIAAIRLANA